MYINIFVIFSFLCLNACTTKKETIKNRPAETLYKEGVQAMKAEDYEKAAQYFNEVDTQHPYSKWSKKSQIMLAYAHYEHQKYDLAVAALDTFIQLHPTHPDISYAYYLKALCHYEQISDIKRDQEPAVEALTSLNALIYRFPQSKYAKDAKIKRQYVKDHLAGQDMEVGRFYLESGQFAAAINRFRYVIEKHQTTSHVPEALHRLVEAYLSLGMEKEAVQIGSVLAHNFKGSEWYADTYYLLKGVDLRPKGKKAEFPSWLGNLFGNQS